MIPITIKLQNFMAYQEAELDFRGFQLAALTGPNGAGKSSLLDAMTWALWGKARAKDDSLVRLGTDDMEVEYCFDFHGNIHRVIRKRSSKGRGRSTLSFQVETEMGWRDLSETSIRATQNKIDQVMRLDYDTFINSAFLLQGRDNEFTTKSPSQRKDILSNILGLTMYDVYAERAKERAKTAKLEVAVYEAKIKQIDDELTHQAEYQAALKQAEQDVITLTQQREVADKEAQLLYEKHRAMSDKRRQLADLENRVKGAQGDIDYLQQSLARSREAILRYEAIIAEKAEIEAGMAQLESAQQAVEDWEERLQTMSQLTHKQHALEREIASAEAKLQAELRGLDTTIGLLTPKVQGIEKNKTDLASLTEELTALEALQEQQKVEQTRLSEIGAEMARLTEQQNQITAEGQTLKGKMAELTQAGAFCPVCKTALNDEHRATAIAQFESEIEGKRGTYRHNQQVINSLTEEQTNRQEVMVQAEKVLKKLGSVQRKIATLQNAIQEAEQATLDLQKVETERTALQTVLLGQNFASETRLELAEVEKYLNTVNYDRKAHEQAKARSGQLRRFETAARNLKDAEFRLPEETARAAEEQSRFTRLTAQIEADQHQMTELQAETTTLVEVSQQLKIARTQAEEYQLLERKARDRVAAANQQLTYLTKLAEQRLEHGEVLQGAQKTFSIYQELQGAFGKKGVQALLIESAIPEIEHEANHLLNRMTDGRMHLRFETQRETKSGDNVVETLDIRIADELGTRDYDLFSGGEAFRINFAIRIAISKVLARRAGAQLQTLIIDEGFGSQDGQGRERLVEAINRIQDNFEKVVVITHVEELKDAFPVRIEVEKLTAGSRLQVRGI